MTSCGGAESVAVEALASESRISAVSGLAVVDAVPMGLDWQPEEYRGRARVGRDTVDLGRRLFFDPRLSASGEMSCATCHDPRRAFTDGRARFLGDNGEVGERNTPTIVNRNQGIRQFWDGRSDDLADQALGPLLSAAEMGLTEALFAQRFASDSRAVAAFEAVFGGPPSLDRAASAIAAYEATVVSGDAPFDRYEWLGDSAAIDAAAARGLALFRGKAKCTTCHVGTNFTDERFHNLGLAGGEAGHASVTGRAEDRGAYKTPTLRNVEHTAPYMHDGSLATLAEVLEFYNDGGRPDPDLDPEIVPLGLNDTELADLESFLKTLTGPIVELDPALFETATEQ